MTQAQLKKMVKLVEKKTSTGGQVDSDALKVAELVVPMLMSEKDVLSFGTMAKLLFGRSHRRGDITQMARVLTKVEPGADALMIAASGEYGAKVKEQHTAWIEKQGGEFSYAVQYTDESIENLRKVALK